MLDFAISSGFFDFLSAYAFNLSSRIRIASASSSSSEAKRSTSSSSSPAAFLVEAGAWIVAGADLKGHEPTAKVFFSASENELIWLYHLKAWG